MAARTLPGLGLSGFASKYDEDWHLWTNPNWRIVSALLQGRVLSAVTAIPGSPSNGDMYIVPAADGSNPNKIALRDNGAWVYLTPQSGWRMFAIDDGYEYIFDGSAWGTTAKIGNVALHPAATVTPSTNGELTFELTSNTSLKVKVKGSDGVVRSATLTLT